MSDKKEREQLARIAATVGAVAAIVATVVAVIFIKQAFDPENRTKLMYSTYCNDELILENYYNPPQIRDGYLHYAYDIGKYAIKIEHCDEILITKRKVPYLTPTPPQ